ncbi:MAG: YgiQ family radical SAM protein [Clostridia bacterium]
MFLPISKEDLKTRNISQLDFIMVTGEAYTDHPSFGHAIISRYIESMGFTIGIIAQPQKEEDYKKLGIPKYAFLVSSGVIDSMVNNYTVSKKKRNKDVYSPGSKIGLRPDMATIVYTKILKKLFPDIFCIAGSIEVSLRKFAHYDYWQDKIIPSIIVSSGADLCIYGMGENPIKEICDKIKKNIPLQNMKDIRGTFYIEKDIKKVENKKDILIIPSYEEVLENKKIYAEAHMQVLKEQDDIYGKVIAQKHGNIYVVQNAPTAPLTTKELDYIYDLPYEGTYHDVYKSQGGIAAIEEVEFSLVSNRGCFGGCNYCALTYHQGRKLSVRSHESIIREAKKLINKPNFKGYIHDVGGPTANFRAPSCIKQEKYGVCKDRQCLFPTPCKNLNVDHSDYINLLRKLRSLDKVKKVFIRSGIRFDYLLADKDETFLKELCQYHVSGQLKVAPEHSESVVLKKMGKPDFEVYKRFVVKFNNMNKKIKKEQYIVPYYISSHPGCNLKSAIKLSEYLKSIHYMPEQVQDFYPTPATISTCMYYTDLDPRNMEKVYVPNNEHEKRLQRALLQYRKPENYDLVKEALIKADRLDLIGFDEKCLIRPKDIDKNKILSIKRQSNLIKQDKINKSKSRIRNIHKKKVK